MAATTRRVVITGIGLITPIGLNAASYWRSLEEGRSGIRPIRTFDASGLPVRFAGVNFRQDDWLYADEDGMVIAPRSLL